MRRKPCRCSVITAWARSQPRSLVLRYPSPLWWFILSTKRWTCSRIPSRSSLPANEKNRPDPEVDVCSNCASSAAALSGLEIQTAFEEHLNNADQNGAGSVSGGWGTILMVSWWFTGHGRCSGWRLRDVVVRNAGFLQTSDLLLFSVCLFLRSLNAAGTSIDCSKEYNYISAVNHQGMTSGTLLKTDLHPIWNKYY